MLARLFKLLIVWLFKRQPRWWSQRVVTFDKGFLFRRFSPFWTDESVYRGVHHNRPPWWRPFNVLLHWWNAAENSREGFHDHPRWSITICLRGKLIEHTPWGARTLTPGSIVVRSRKAIHAFEMMPGHRGKTWTLFIVGRRNHSQNRYVITPFGKETHFKD